MATSLLFLTVYSLYSTYKRKGLIRFLGRNVVQISTDFGNRRGQPESRTTRASPPCTELVSNPWINFYFLLIEGPTHYIKC